MQVGGLSKSVSYLLQQVGRKSREKKQRRENKQQKEVRVITLTPFEVREYQQEARECMTSMIQMRNFFDGLLKDSNSMISEIYREVYVKDKREIFNLPFTPWEVITTEGINNG